jgi:hypothetical protein
MAKNERTFRSIKADFFEFAEIGQSLEGTLVVRDSMTFHRAGTSTDVGKYTIQTDEGERISFLGGTVVDQTLEGVELGTYIRITYIGKKKTANQMEMKDFDIEIAE